MKNYTEFQRVTRVLEDKLSFEDDISVSVFESNIRSKFTYCFCRIYIVLLILEKI